MSSILKALRKLEADKSALGEGSVDIGRDILKRSYQQPTSRPAAFYLVPVLLGAVLVFATLWWLTGEDSPQGAVNLQQSIPAATIEKEETPLPLSAKTYNDSVAATEPDSTIRPQKEALPKTVKKPIQERIEKPVAQATIPAKPLVAEPAPIVLPDLRVEEIVYQQQPSARLAVINDLPVMEGTDIEGARVIAILQDRVRFSFQGVQFDKYTDPENR